MSEQFPKSNYTMPQIADPDLPTKPFHLSFGNGWVVSCLASFNFDMKYTTAPCKLSSGDKHFWARVDLNECVFIDPIPVEMEKNVIKTLVQMITG